MSKRQFKKANPVEPTVEPALLKAVEAALKHLGSADELAVTNLVMEIIFKKGFDSEKMNITKVEYDEIIKQPSYPINVSKYFKKTHQITTVDVKNALHLLVKNNPNSFSRTSGVPYGFDNPSFPKYYYKEQPKAVSGTEFIKQATVSYPQPQMPVVACPQPQVSQAPVVACPQPQVPVVVYPPPLQAPITNPQKEFIENLINTMGKIGLIKVFIDGSTIQLLNCNVGGLIQFSKSIRNQNTLITDDTVVTMTSVITTHSNRESLDFIYVILSKYKGFKTALIPLLKVADNRNIIYVESYKELLDELIKVKLD